MDSLLQNLSRRVIPRKVRNWLRSPGKTMTWVLNEWRGPIDLSLRPDWSIKCPRNAAASAFRCVVYDPAQVVECDDFIRSVKQLPKVVLLDVGSHFGVFCFAAVHYGGPTARVVAVDPSSEAKQMVKRIAVLNSCEQQVKFVQAAVGAAVGTLSMVETGPTADGYMVLPKDQPESDRTQIPMTTVDGLVADMGELPTTIKIDVESFELEVLRGGPQTFGKHAIPVNLEMHNQMLRERGQDPKSVLEALRDYGYLQFQSGGKTLSEAQLLKADLIRYVALKR